MLLLLLLLPLNGLVRTNTGLHYPMTLSVFLSLLLCLGKVEALGVGWMEHRIQNLGYERWCKMESALKYGYDENRRWLN